MSHLQQNFALSDSTMNDNHHLNRPMINADVAVDSETDTIHSAPSSLDFAAGTPTSDTSIEIEESRNPAITEFARDLPAWTTLHVAKSETPESDQKDFDELQVDVDDLSKSKKTSPRSRKRQALKETSNNNINLVTDSQPQKPASAPKISRTAQEIVADRIDVNDRPRSKTEKGRNQGALIFEGVMITTPSPRKRRKMSSPVPREDARFPESARGRQLRDHLSVVQPPSSSVPIANTPSSAGFEVSVADASGQDPNLRYTGSKVSWAQAPDLNLGSDQQGIPKHARTEPPLKTQEASWFSEGLASTSSHSQAPAGSHGTEHGGLSLVQALSLAFSQNVHHAPPPGAIPPPSPSKRSRKLVPHRLLRRRQDVIARQKVLDAVLDEVEDTASPEEVNLALETEEAPVAFSRRVAMWGQEISEGLSREQAMAVSQDSMKDSTAQHGPGARERPRLIPDPSRTVMFVERLENMFGPGSIYRGSTKKRPAKGKTRSYASRTRYASPRLLSTTNEDNASASETESLSRSESMAVETAQDADLLSGMPQELVVEQQSKVQRGIECNAEEPMEVTALGVDEDKASEWVAALQKLIKGKTASDRDGLRCISNVLKGVEEAKSSLHPHVLQESRLQETIIQLSQLPAFQVPFSDEHELRRRAKAIAGFWGDRFC